MNEPKEIPDLNVSKEPSTKMLIVMNSQSRRVLDRIMEMTENRYSKSALVRYGLTKVLEELEKNQVN